MYTTKLIIRLVAILHTAYCILRIAKSMLHTAYCMLHAAYGMLNLDPKKRFNSLTPLDRAVRGQDFTTNN